MALSFPRRVITPLEHVWHVTTVSCMYIYPGNRTKNACLDQVGQFNIILRLDCHTAASDLNIYIVDFLSGLYTDYT